MNVILLVFIYLTIQINCEGGEREDDICPDAQCIDVIQEMLFISLTVKDRIDEETVEIFLSWIDKGCENILEDLAALVRSTTLADKNQRKSDDAELAPIVGVIIPKLSSNNPKDKAAVKLLMASFKDDAHFGEWNRNDGDGVESALYGSNLDTSIIDAEDASLVDDIPIRLRRSANTENLIEGNPENGSPLNARFFLGLFGKPTCGLNEESYCNYQCNNLTCANYKTEIQNYLFCVTQNMRIDHKVCLFGTWSNCECALGLVRDESTQKCIPLEYCPKKHKKTTTQKPTSSSIIGDKESTSTITPSTTTPVTSTTTTTTPTIKD